MRVQSLKKFSVAAASRFAVDMCGVGWAVPARSAEDNTVYQRCNDIGTRERKTDRKVVKKAWAQALQMLWVLSEEGVLWGSWGT